ncbi:hypothetical protein RJT34_24587 [Clitoria ternatea]|uniref:Uncharacterized protein n=1 Tax=Clitoria ternatea TaxID=43366 RepID=A0AAN9II51_CLITE
MAKTTEIAVMEETTPPKQQPPPNPFSFFQNLNLQLPFFPPKRKPKPQPQPNNTPNLNLDTPKPTVVRFPKTKVVVPPIEADPEDAELSTPNPPDPLIRWQIYVLGAVLISRWIWAKWNERQERRPPGDDRAE